jgi:hypothetical protein
LPAVGGDEGAFLNDSIALLRKLRMKDETVTGLVETFRKAWERNKEGGIVREALRTRRLQSLGVCRANHRKAHHAFLLKYAI